MSLFVDSSAWYAAADSADHTHDRAVEILSAGERLVTTDHVLVETWQLLRHRIGRGAAERFWDGLRSGAAAVEPVGSGDMEVAWTIGELFPDQDFSVVARTCFAVIVRLGIERVASLDDDFAVYRYGRRRGRAFTIVR